jgi:hypothetical protein
MEGLKMEGLKYDNDKPMWNLLPMASVEEVVKVLTYGAKKYSADNWRKVDSERYFAAFMRHIAAWRKGETHDVESGLHHLAHAITNLLFAMEHEREDNENNWNAVLEIFAPIVSSETLLKYVAATELKMLPPARTPIGNTLGGASLFNDQPTVYGAI